MSSWGDNNQPTTANSTTTMETSTGAPIGTYALVKGAKASGISMVANAKFGNTSPGSAASIDVEMFDNTTPSAFITGAAYGVFGVSPQQADVSDCPAGLTHAGWVLRKVGTGPVVSFTYTGTATGYNNTDVITVASNTAGGNASITMTTNSTGGALTFVIGGNNVGFTTKNPTVHIANSTGGATSGSGATFVATTGGRAGRVQLETLVASSSVSNNDTGASGIFPTT